MVRVAGPLTLRVPQLPVLAVVVTLLLPLNVPVHSPAQGSRAGVVVGGTGVMVGIARVGVGGAGVNVAAGLAVGVAGAGGAGAGAGGWVPSTTNTSVPSGHPPGGVKRPSKT